MDFKIKQLVPVNGMRVQINEETYPVSCAALIEEDHRQSIVPVYFNEDGQAILLDDHVRDFNIIYL